VVRLHPYNRATSNNKTYVLCYCPISTPKKNKNPPKPSRVIWGNICTLYVIFPHVKNIRLYELKSWFLGISQTGVFNKKNFFRETRDGCDPCPGPFGGPRNRTSEASSGTAPARKPAPPKPAPSPVAAPARPNNNNNNNRGQGWYIKIVQQYNKSTCRGPRSGASLTTSEFTTTYNASVVLGWYVFQNRRNYFYFQSALGYPWRCKFLNAGVVTHDRRIGSRVETGCAIKMRTISVP
jgi:hypothetical protein